LFHFDDPALAVASSSGVIQQQGRSFTHGYELHLEQATLQFEMAVTKGTAPTLIPLTIYRKDGRVQQPRLSGGDPIDAFVGELREIQQAIKANKPSPVLAAELARDAIRLCHRQTQSVRRQRMTKV